MKILITGSNGFVGSALMPFLENKGYEVFGIDRDSKSIYPKHKNTIVGDIVNIDSIEALQIPFDIIIHCAAAKNDFGISDEEYYKDNEAVTSILTAYAEKLNIRKIIYYSTVSVYGHQDKPCDETGQLLSNTVYGDSKLAGEVVIEKWLDLNTENKAIFLRPSVIYGPNNYANMYNLINTLYGKPLVMVGKGTHIKSMVALTNLVDMTYFAIEKGFEEKLLAYNCLDKPYYSVNQLMKLITKDDAFNMPKINVPLWMAYVLATPFEIATKITGKDLKVNWNRLKKFATATDYLSEKIREDGYTQQYSVEDEILKMVKWYKSQKND